MQPGLSVAVQSPKTEEALNVLSPSLVRQRSAAAVASLKAGKSEELNLKRGVGRESF
jgi:hypothetical protein